MLIEASNNDPTDELDEVVKVITRFLDEPEEEEETSELDASLLASCRL